MPRIPAVSRQLVAGMLVTAGAVWFLAGSHVVPAAAGTVAVDLLALVILGWLITHVDPAWVLSAGMVSTMFSDHWDQLGLASGVSPDRVLLGAGILAVLLRLPPARDRPDLRLTGAHYALAAALVYALVSAIFAGTLTTHNSEVLLLDQYGALPFLLFVIAPVAFVTARQRRILLGSLVAAGAYLSITALFEKLKLTALVVPSYITDPSVGQHYGRARGPFVESGAEGLALYISVVSAAIGLTIWRVGWQRLAMVGVVVLGTVGILLTVTRGAWLAGVAATLVVLLTTAPLRRYLVPVGAAGMVTILLALATIPGLAGQVQQRQSDQEPIYERQNVDAAALRMVAAHPLIGFGWERANESIQPYFRTDPNIPLVGLFAGFHDVYLKYAVELGVVGLMLWLGALGLALGRAATARAPPELVAWQAGLRGIWVAWLIIALSSPASYLFATIVLWTIGGIVFAEKGRLTTPAQPARATGPTLMGAARP